MSINSQLLTAASADALLRVFDELKAKPAFTLVNLATAVHLLKKHLANGATVDASKLDSFVNDVASLYGSVARSDITPRVVSTILNGLGRIRVCTPALGAQLSEHCVQLAPTMSALVSAVLS